MDDLDFPEPIAAPVPEPAPRWQGPLIPLLGLCLSLFFLSEERASLAYYVARPTPVDLGAPGAYRFSEARDEAFVRIQGELGGAPIPFRRGWERREAVPLLDTPVLIDRAPGSGRRGPAVVEGRLLMDDRLPQFRKVIEVLLKRDLLAAPGAPLQTDHVWVLREGSRPWHLDGDSGWCLLLIALAGLNAWWVGERLWARLRHRRSAETTG